MSRLDDVINQVKATRHTAWIYDDEARIKSNVICADVLPWLKELKAYEINVNDDFIIDFMKNAEVLNTYTTGGKTDKNIVVWYKPNCPVAVICIHLFGDERQGFSNFFAVKMDGDAFVAIQEIESATQVHEVIGRFLCDVNLFSETYNVHDTLIAEDVGYYHAMEDDDLLSDLEEKGVLV